MALTRKQDWSYGENQADIRAELERYSSTNYPARHFADAVCSCKNQVFRLLMDDTEGVTARICTSCGSQYWMGDSEDFLEDAEPEECQCLCGNEDFEITAGVALYQDSQDVKWLYIGCRCPSCGLTACYGDWKNEFEGYQELLSRI